MSGGVTPYNVKTISIYFAWLQFPLQFGLFSDNNPERPLSNHGLCFGSS
jgi:hypothetical protein